MKKNSLLLLIVILNSILIEVCMQTTYKIQAVQSKNTLNMRMKSVIKIQEPDYEFKRVEKKQVFQIVNNKRQAFKSCEEVDPIVDFVPKSKDSFNSTFKNKFIITDIKDIINGQNLIDIYHVQNKIYVMLQKGDIIVYLYDFRQWKIIKRIVIKGIGSMETGYFFSISKRIYFVNQRFLMQISDSEEKIFQFKGYNSNTNLQFQNVAKIDDEHIAICFLNSVKIYQINQKNNTVVLLDTLDAQYFKDNKFQPIYLLDIAFSTMRNILFVLQEKGLYSIQISRTDSKHQLKTQTKPGYLSLGKCTMMSIDDNYLYAACSQNLIKIQMFNWPRVFEKSIKSKLHSVLEIVPDQELIALVGMSVFQLIYIQRYALYFKDHKLQKLILDDGRFISASEDELVVGNYMIKPPGIRCQFVNDSLIGEHQLQILTTARCDREYFQKYGLPKVNSGDKDNCLYRSLVKVNIWKAGELKKSILLPFLLFSLLIVLLVLFVYMLNHCQLKRINKQFKLVQNVQNIQLEEVQAQPGRVASFGSHDIQ